MNESDSEPIQSTPSDISEKRQFHAPGTVMVTPNGIRYVLVAGKGWVRLDEPKES